MIEPYSEIYAPKDLDSMTNQIKINEMLKKSIKDESFPHHIFCGPHASGKMLTAINIGKALYKDCTENLLIISAFEENGIEVIREKIKTFARLTVSVKFKLIIVRDADYLTYVAQSALRRIIEDFSSTTRFCFLCSNIDKIIEPIMSRCIIVNFEPHSQIYIRNHLEMIAKKENISLNLDEILNSSTDIRTAINKLQNNYAKPTTNISLEKLKEFKNISQINSYIFKLQSNCVDIELFHKDLLQNIISDKTIDDKERSKYALIVINSLDSLLLGNDEYLVLMNMIGKISL